MLQLLSSGNIWSLSFEVPFILWLQSLGGEGTFIYYLMRFFTLFGEEMLLVGIMGLIYWGLDKNRGEKIGVMMLTTVLLNPMIKNIVRRERPFIAEPDVQNLKNVDGFSFPSGHSSGSAAMFGGTAVTYKDKVRHRKWMIPIAVVIPLLVALSRNYLGAHYLTDVVAGLALGIGIVFLIDLLLKVLPSKWWLYGGLLVIGFAGMFYCTTTDYFTGYGLLFGFVFGVLFENKVVKFENTKVWWQIILRLVCGGIIYLALNTLIKLPFNFMFEELADGKVVKEQFVILERFIRTLRYAIIGFVCMGLYPMLFKHFDKLNNLRKKKENTEDLESVTASETETQSE